MSGLFFHRRESFGVAGGTVQAAPKFCESVCEKAIYFLPAAQYNETVCSVIEERREHAEGALAAF